MIGEEAVAFEALFSASADVSHRCLRIYTAPETAGLDILIASLSFQLPAMDGLGTGFLILSLIFFFSCSGLMESLTALASKNPDLEDAVAAVAH